ncbi:fumarylacetoacetate hydrolase family protein [Desulfurispira natronophila]|uniref:5-carboxymethyl-2-hydroxymuconate isomerase n=1 Tax=Desulfurispira natronophila TaxID=682562 RepID=A0A7W8DG03_9BACT|nr:fumarylacetoacetate hydrolase family protein [Desulfurispira natronophila]MBB5020971.1 5-carboxymethyl-2-hydroxymuconate isomerase [Desulfurispira natronophila]
MHSAAFDTGELFTPSKIVCVAKNYHDHAREMGDAAPTEPLFFIKPNSALWPQGTMVVSKPRWTEDFQHEIELAIRISRQCSQVSPKEVFRYCDAAAVGIDFTARDAQARLKNAGHPWELAKAFDGACLLSTFVKFSSLEKLQKLNLELRVNDELRQQGNSAHMIHQIPFLISAASKLFTLEPGDVILTGTPAGVSPLVKGDSVVASIEDIGEIQFVVDEV